MSAASKTRIIAPAALRWRRGGAFVLLALAGVACDGTSGSSVRQSQAILYDGDDRVEVADAPDVATTALAQASVGALVPRVLLRSAGDDWVIAAPTLGERLDLCAGEAFAKQPSAALCSGVLVGSDVFLTAGHCLIDTQSCRDGFVIAFGYALDADGAVRISRSRTFECAEVLAYRNDELTARPSLDFAVLRLDRPVGPGLTPVGVTELGEEHQALRLIGASEGLPLKLHRDVELLSVDRDAGYAHVRADAFGGDSGAPLLSPEGQLLGIMTGGHADYEREAAGCWTRRRASEREAESGEQVTLAAAIAPQLPVPSRDGRGHASCRFGQSPLPTSSWLAVGVATCLALRRRRA